MSELLTMVMEQGKKIESIYKMVNDLTALVMKDKVNTIWVDENIAAEMLGMHPETLRRKVKSAISNNQFPMNQISYRNSNGRKFQYSRKSLMRYMELTSIQ